MTSLPQRPAALSINLNKIALLRNSRSGDYPSVLAHAHRVIAAGATGITIHPRPDQRHIRTSDARQLALLLEEYPGIEYNIEGNPFAPARGDYPGFIKLVTECRPDQCTLVPDGDDQLTSDHGFDLRRDGERLAPIIAELKALGIRVSLFMDPDREQITRAATIGADRIELYTGPYAAAWGGPDVEREWQRHRDAAAVASDLGLGVNAGHDLNLDNLARYAQIAQLEEVSIGHAFTVDAIDRGLNATVAAYLAELDSGHALRTAL
jgi:pyridoxine 5-phosphate synthase